MKSLFISIFILFFSAFQQFSFTEAKINREHTSFKLFDKVVEEAEDKIKHRIRGIYSIKMTVKYKTSDSKTTCSATIRSLITMDYKSLEIISKNEIKEIIFKSFFESVDNSICLNVFFCIVTKAKIEYEIIPVKLIYKKKKLEEKEVA